MKLPRLVFAAVLLCLCAVPLHAQDVPSDSSRMAGTWTMLSGSANGMSMPPEYLSQMAREFSGNQVTVTMAGRTFFTATIVLHPEQTPRGIDYHMTTGPTAGQVQLGIYEIRGDTLHFAFAAVGAPRPTDFSTSSGDGRTVSTWVRKQ